MFGLFGPRNPWQLGTGFQCYLPHCRKPFYGANRIHNTPCLKYFLHFGRQRPLSFRRKDPTFLEVWRGRPKTFGPHHPQCCGLKCFVARAFCRPFDIEVEFPNHELPYFGAPYVWKNNIIENTVIIEIRTTKHANCTTTATTTTTSAEVPGIPVLAVIVRPTVLSQTLKFAIDLSWDPCEMLQMKMKIIVSGGHFPPLICINLFSK